MNKLIILCCALVVTITLFFSCTKQNVKSTPTTFILQNGNGSLQLLTIDSCQYLYGPWGNATVLTHKGNCNNPQHRDNQN